MVDDGSTERSDEEHWHSRTSADSIHTDSEADQVRATERPNDRIPRRTLLKSVSALGLGLGIAGSTFVNPVAAENTTELKLDADVTTVEKPTRIREYPVMDIDGQQTATRTWRVVRGTSNCCENYLTTAPDGSLYDAGSKYVFATHDDGKTWKRVAPSTPWPETAEGVVSAAPNGDIVAIDWDPYSGDRLVAFKYDAGDEKWYYNEVPLHTPFYDREWFAVVPGPITVGGEEYPYIVVMQGGGFGKEAVFYTSLDGLNYTRATNRAIDSESNGSVEEYLDVPTDAILDYVQPISVPGMTPLGDGRMLTDDTYLQAQLGTTEVGADHTLLRNDPDGNVNYYEFDTPAGLPEGRFLTGSRGYLHSVNFETRSTFVYRYSTDGGENWTEYRYDLPGNYELRDDYLWDFKANGDLEIVAISVHATDPKANADQDMVFRLTDVAPGTTPETEVLYLGKADVSYVVGVSTSERFDFTTLAILPDGRIAVSYADSESPNPRVAIEAPGETPEGPPLDLSASRSDDGSVFTGGQTDEVQVMTTPDRDAVIRDVVPEEWNVLESYSSDIERVEHRKNAGVKYVYFHGTAPAGDQSSYTYFAEAPDGASKTGQYTFGPVQGRPVDGEAWVSAAGSTDANTVVGSDTNT